MTWRKTWESRKKGRFILLLLYTVHAACFFKYYLTDLLRLIECKISRKRWPRVNNTICVFNTAYNVVAHPTRLGRDGTDDVR